MMTPFISGPVEVRDLADRRITYTLVWDESGETLGMMAYIDGRLACLCSEGRQRYEDRLDGSVPWASGGCPHEVAYLEYKAMVARESSGGLTNARTFDAGVFCD